MPGLTGKTLDHYRLIEQIGQGGMATIYRAQDTQTLQDVAVKVLSPTISQDKRFVRRFRREAGLVVRMKHPRIVPVLDYGEAEGMVYLVMPFIAGKNLNEHIRQHRLSTTNLLRWANDIAEALHYAHTKGIIHRDIKPSNVIINTAGDALLTDFGLAKMADQSSTLTGSMLMGTPAYISPEQGRGQDLDHRSDQYAFGIMLYQLLTGSLPFDGDNPMSIILKHLQEPVPRLRTLNQHIPQTVENIIIKSLAKEPQDRFESVKQLNRLFQAAMRGEQIPDFSMPTEIFPGVEPPTKPVAEGKPARRSRRVVAALLIAALTITAVVIVTRLNQSPAVIAEAIIPSVLPSEATGTVPALISLPSPTPQPSAVPPIVSQACPGVSLIWLPPAGNQAQWLLDNLSNEAYRLQDLQALTWPTANGELEYILLGEQVIWSRDETEQGAWREDVSRILPAQTSLTLTLDFDWEAGQSGYAFDLLLDPACELRGSW